MTGSKPGEIGSPLLRGVVAAVGASLLVCEDAINMWLELTLGSSRPTPETAASLPQLFASGLAWAGGLALVVGLVGLYLRQAPAAGRLGLVGFLLALLGTAAMAGSDWTGLFVIPHLATTLPDWLSNPPDGVGLATLANFIVYALGWLLFGIATLRAGVFPRAAGAAVTLGIVASIAAPLSLGFLLFELGLLWLGVFATRRPCAIM